jgi:hypothetical protein
VSSQIGANATALSGVPDQVSGGEMSLPLQVQSFGIALPAVKAGLSMRIVRPLALISGRSESGDGLRAHVRKKQGDD